jgi:hypothetical protein
MTGAGNVETTAATGGVASTGGLGMTSGAGAAVVFTAVVFT